MGKRQLKRAEFSGRSVYYDSAYLIIVSSFKSMLDLIVKHFNSHSLQATCEALIGPLLQLHGVKVRDGTTYPKAFKRAVTAICAVNKDIFHAINSSCLSGNSSVVNQSMVNDCIEVKELKQRNGLGLKLELDRGTFCLSDKAKSHEWSNDFLTVGLNTSLTMDDCKDESGEYPSTTSLRDAVPTESEASKEGYQVAGGDFVSAATDGQEIKYSCALKNIDTKLENKSESQFVNFAHGGTSPSDVASLRSTTSRACEMKQMLDEEMETRSDLADHESCVNDVVQRSQHSMPVDGEAGDKVETCDICNMGFMSTEALEEHEWSLLHHIKLEKVKTSRGHDCKLCTRSFPTLADYSDHVESKPHLENVARRQQLRHLKSNRQKTPHQSVTSYSWGVEGEYPQIFSGHSPPAFMNRWYDDLNRGQQFEWPLRHRGDPYRNSPSTFNNYYPKPLFWHPSMSRMRPPLLRAPHCLPPFVPAMWPGFRRNRPLINNPPLHAFQPRDAFSGKCDFQKPFRDNIPNTSNFGPWTRHTNERFSTPLVHPEPELIQTPGVFVPDVVQCDRLNPVTSGFQYHTRGFKSFTTGSANLLSRKRRCKSKLKTSDKISKQFKLSEFKEHIDNTLSAVVPSAIENVSTPKNSMEALSSISRKSRPRKIRSPCETNKGCSSLKKPIAISPTSGVMNANSKIQPATKRAVSPGLRSKSTVDVVTPKTSTNRQASSLANSKTKQKAISGSCSTGRSAPIASVNDRALSKQSALKVDDLMRRANRAGVSRVMSKKALQARLKQFKTPTSSVDCNPVGEHTNTALASEASVILKPTDKTSKPISSDSLWSRGQQSILSQQIARANSELQNAPSIEQSFNFVANQSVNAGNVDIVELSPTTSGADIARHNARDSLNSDRSSIDENILPHQNINSFAGVEVCTSNIANIVENEKIRCDGDGTGNSQPASYSVASTSAFAVDSEYAKSAMRLTVLQELWEVCKAEEALQAELLSLDVTIPALEAALKESESRRRDLESESSVLKEKRLQLLKANCGPAQDAAAEEEDCAVSADSLMESVHNETNVNEPSPSHAATDCLGSTAIPNTIDDAISTTLELQNMRGVPRSSHFDGAETLSHEKLIHSMPHLPGFNEQHLIDSLAAIAAPVSSNHCDIRASETGTSCEVIVDRSVQRKPWSFAKFPLDQIKPEPLDEHFDCVIKDSNNGSGCSESLANSIVQPSDEHRDVTDSNSKTSPAVPLMSPPVLSVSHDGSRHDSDSDSGYRLEYLGAIPGGSLELLHKLMKR